MVDIRPGPTHSACARIGMRKGEALTVALVPRPNCPDSGETISRRMGEGKGDGRSSGINRWP